MNVVLGMMELAILSVWVRTNFRTTVDWNARLVKSTPLQCVRSKAASVMTV